MKYANKAQVAFLAGAVKAVLDDLWDGDNGYTCNMLRRELAARHPGDRRYGEGLRDWLDDSFNLSAKFWLVIKEQRVAANDNDRKRQLFSPEGRLCRMAWLTVLHAGLVNGAIKVPQHLFEGYLE